MSTGQLAVPTANPKSSQSAPPDTVAVKELLDMMNRTLATLGKTFDSLTEQSTRVATLGPQMESAHQIHQLRRQMRAQEKKQDSRINEVKHIVREVLKEEIAKVLGPDISTAVRDEVRSQTSAEVRNQLSHHLPYDLHKQAELSRQQLKDVQCSLRNSESRRANSTLRASNLEDEIATILKSNGEESRYFPRNLKTLFSYDDNTAKELVKDYNLPTSDSREKNLNKWMAHAGIQFHLIP
ncbi:hypothetical protein FRB99_001548 [Tulasnella sp. 403]|nr:hypothetical protein FRB99_001548 [Tulasnella sp. 403]